MHTNPERMEIEKEFGFESAHRLPNVPAGHKCHRIHGHSFRVVVRVRGPLDDKMGWLVDFADLRAAWEPLGNTLDHHLLNEVPGLENPTSENIAKWIADRLKVPAPAELASITVKETCTSSCTLYR